MDSSSELREKVVFKLLDKEKYFLDPPFNIVMASSIICSYIENNKVPGSNMWQEVDSFDEVVYKIAKDIYQERKYTINTADQKSPSNNSLIKKMLRFFGL